MAAEALSFKTDKGFWGSHSISQSKTAIGLGWLLLIAVLGPLGDVYGFTGTTGFTGLASLAKAALASA
jgi:hypothetical protein